MDFNNLNDAEVKEIIQRLKHPKKLLSFQKIVQQLTSMLFGKIKIDELVFDEDGIDYIFHIYRGEIDPNRFSIHLRLKEFSHHIIRLDINPTQPHPNPDGREINSSHLHIYSNKFPKRDLIAIPLEETDFPNVETIIEAVNAFLKYSNIQEGDSIDNSF